MRTLYLKDIQLDLGYTSPYNISMDRIGITKMSRRFVATMNNFKGKECHVKETPKQITEYIEKRMDALAESGEFIIERTREYLPQQKKSVPGFKLMLRDEFYPSPEYQDTTIRVIAWHPFPVIFYPNFNRILARMCDRDNVKYKLPEGHDNAFEYIGINRMALKHIALAIMKLKNLEENFIDPVLKKMFPEYANSYIYNSSTINQCEITCDIPTKSSSEADECIYQWATQNMRIFTHSQLECEDGKPIFHFKTGDGLRFKIYSKGKVIRLEFTYDRTYLDDAKISRNSIKEIFDDAEKQFKDLDESTKEVQIQKVEPSKETMRKLHIATRSEKDIGILKSLAHRTMEWFKSGYVQEELNITRSMVNYRLSVKFNWLLEKKGRKWKLKEGAIQIVKYFLGMIDELEYRIRRWMGSEETKTFGIGILVTD